MSKNGISRRDFMRTTASGALAGSILLEPRPIEASPRPVPPSDTVRFGIIGVGMRGSGLLSTAIQLPGVECVAACELYDGRVTLAKEIVGKPITVTRRYQDLLDRKDIDCIIAPVPDHWHHRIVTDCCKAGKDVYVEKPMTHTVEEGFEIIDAANRYNRIVQVGSQEPSSVVYQKMKELFAENVLGDLCLVEAQMGRNDYCGAWGYTVPPNLSPQTLDWETWQAPARRHVSFDKIRWTRWRCFNDYVAASKGIHTRWPLSLEGWPRRPGRDDHGLRVPGLQSDPASDAQHGYRGRIQFHGQSRHHVRSGRRESGWVFHHPAGWPGPQPLHSGLAESHAPDLCQEMARRTRCEARNR